MKRIILLLTIAFMLVNTPTPAFSQFDVTYDWVFKSQSLAGTIRIKLTNEALSGVLVEEMTPNWKTVISSTRTDEKGHFSIPNPASKNLHYLRLSGDGLCTTNVTVRISKWARKKELTLFISVAT
jgi:hypothetical protein